MSFSNDSESSVKCKAFISEDEIAERKKRRQEEWEKVRKPDDPLEVPEEEYDPRSLYERLQEQKEKKQAEYEESHRLKNLIKGLDDDEVAFLELVDKTKLEMEAKLWNEEMKELQEFKKAVAHISEEESEARLAELRKALRLQMKNTSKKSQQALLSAAIKRKASNGTTSQEKKPRTSSEQEQDETSQNGTSEKEEEATNSSSTPSSDEKRPVIRSHGTGALKCLGVLPGLGAYTDSSDSDNSSCSDNEKESDFDLIGRKRICVHSNTSTTPAKSKSE